ncbi:hypothetical protein WJX72_002025 [[Myrmecia] bisecta]|uniref:PARP-type domain-containing protein n=1 Tax=[Myrmecia] bisecta TaxID=41462 RepID=A0AAW1QPB4_9CHLO
MSAVYSIEYAKSGRAGCKAGKSCTDKTIKQGDLRLGTTYDSGAFVGTSWRHWLCTTPKVLSNIGSVDCLEGFNALTEADKFMVNEAFQHGRVEKPDAEPAEDTAQPSSPKEAKPAKAKKPTKKEQAAAKAEEEEKPAKKARKPTKKQQEAAAAEESEEEESEEEEAKPAPKKRAPTKKQQEAAAAKDKTKAAGKKKAAEPAAEAPAKKRAAKKKEAEPAEEPPAKKARKPSKKQQEADAAAEDEEQEKAAAKPAKKPTKAAGKKKSAEPAEQPPAKKARKPTKKQQEAAARKEVEAAAVEEGEEEGGGSEEAEPAAAPPAKKGRAPTKKQQEAAAAKAAKGNAAAEPAEPEAEEEEAEEEPAEAPQKARKASDKAKKSGQKAEPVAAAPAKGLLLLQGLAPAHAAPVSSLSALNAALQGDLYILSGPNGTDPTSPDFEQLMHVWDQLYAGPAPYLPPTIPSLYVVAQAPEDVVSALEYALLNSVKTSVIGNGHQQAMVAWTQGGLVIDMSNLQDIVVDDVARTVEFQLGVTGGLLANATMPFNLMFNGPHASGVGVSGFTLGGGLGWNGIAVDLITGFDVVNTWTNATKGLSIVHVNATSYPDLVWALRVPDYEANIILAHTPQGPAAIFNQYGFNSDNGTLTGLLDEGLSTAKNAGAAVVIPAYTTYAALSVAQDPSQDYPEVASYTQAADLLVPQLALAMCAASWS